MTYGKNLRKKHQPEHAKSWGFIYASTGRQQRHSVHGEGKQQTTHESQQAAPSTLDHGMVLRRLPCLKCYLDPVSRSACCRL